MYTNDFSPCSLLACPLALDRTVSGPRCDPLLGNIGLRYLAGKTLKRQVYPKDPLSRRVCKFKGIGLASNVFYNCLDNGPLSGRVLGTSSLVPNLAVACAVEKVMGASGISFGCQSREIFTPDVLVQASIKQFGK